MQWRMIVEVSAHVSYVFSKKGERQPMERVDTITGFWLEREWKRTGIKAGLLKVL